MSRDAMDLFSALWPMAMLLVALGFTGRSIRLPRRSQVAWLPWVVATIGLAIFAWKHWQLGVITSNELTHVFKPNRTWYSYLQEDPGNPGRLHRLFGLGLVPLGGLAGFRVLNMVVAVAAAGVLAASYRRISGGVASLFALLVLLEPTWMERMWEARAYAFFLAASVLALWCWTDANERGKEGRIGGFLAVTAIACIENPLCIVLTVAGLLVWCRRRGVASVSRSEWIALSSIVLMTVPMVLWALERHRSLSHQSDKAIWILMGVGAGVGAAATLRRLPSAATGELVLWASALVLAGLYLGFVPSVNRSVLFLFPWLGAALLVLLPADWRVQTAALCFVVYGLVPGQWKRLNRNLQITQNKAEGARSLHESWGQQQTAPVVFRPQWAAPEYLSSLVDLRFAPYSSLEDGPTPLPPMYAPSERGECTAGERGIAYIHGRQVCDCPVEMETKLWVAYACPE